MGVPERIQRKFSGYCGGKNNRNEVVMEVEGK